MSLSRRARSIQPSPTLGISARADELRSQGIDIIDFGAGEPDFPSPDAVKETGIEAIENDFTHYTSASGMPELKQAVADKLANDQQLDYSTSQITIGCGAKHVLFNLAATLLDSGDEVLLPAPYWVSYPEQIRFFGGRPKIIDTTRNDFVPKLEQIEDKITENTKYLLINSPSNPTGTVYSQELLQDIGELCVKNDILLISDEVYEKLIYGDKSHTSPAQLSGKIKENTIIVNGVSKAYAMTGWRIGYAAGPEQIIERINNLMSHSTSNPCSISQKAAIKALKLPDSEIQPMLNKFSERRELTVDKLNSIPGVECSKPGGAFYAFPDVQGLIDSHDNIGSDMELATALINEAHVAVVPGSPFGAPGYLRLSYATSTEKIEAGLERIEGWAAGE